MTRSSVWPITDPDPTYHLTFLDAEHAALLVPLLNRAETYPLRNCSRAGIETALAAPQAGYGGVERYPTIAEKAAVLIYSIAKGHVCSNGNKRLAFVLAATFLVKNDWWLWARQDEVFDRLLAVAASNPHQSDAVKTELAQWIRDHLIASADAHVRIQARIQPGEDAP